MVGGEAIHLGCVWKIGIPTRKQGSVSVGGVRTPGPPERRLANPRQLDRHEVRLALAITGRIGALRKTVLQDSLGRDRGMTRHPGRNFHSRVLIAEHIAAREVAIPLFEPDARHGTCIRGVARSDDDNQPSRIHNERPDQRAGAEFCGSGFSGLGIMVMLAGGEGDRATCEQVNGPTDYPSLPRSSVAAVGAGT